MRRRVSNKHRIRESWDCTNPACGQRIRLSDTHLLAKVALLMNRIIANSYLLIPRPKKRKELSAEAQQINRESDAELERDDPSDALIIVKTIEMAERLYVETVSYTHLPGPGCLSPGNHNGTAVLVAGGGHGGLRSAGVTVPEYR